LGYRKPFAADSAKALYPMLAVTAAGRDCVVLQEFQVCNAFFISFPDSETVPVNAVVYLVNAGGTHF